LVSDISSTLIDLCSYRWLVSDAADVAGATSNEWGISVDAQGVAAHEQGVQWLRSRACSNGSSLTIDG
ncbi:MAG: hypothetical protein ABIR68_17855, partial [Ilumatobacteraceae bacterium]